MSKNLKLVKRITAVVTTVCVVAGLMVSASAYGITVPAEGRFVYDGTESSVTIPVTGTSSSGQVTIVVRRDNDAWLTDPNSNVVFIDQVTGADGATSITFGIDNKWLSANETFKVFVGGSSQAVTSADIFIGGIVTPPEVTLTGIAVSGQKTSYEVGEEFVKPVVTASYSNGTSKDVTADAQFSGFDSSAPVASQTITVTYEDQSTSYTIAIKEPVIIVPGQATLEAKYNNSYNLAGKAVVEAKIAAEDNGNKKVMVGDAELYYSVERGLYVGVIDAANVVDGAIADVSILDEAPTKFVYGNVDGSAFTDANPTAAIKNGDYLWARLYSQGTRQLEAINLIAADVTGDGRIVNGDVLQLRLFMQNGQKFAVLSK